MNTQGVDVTMLRPVQAVLNQLQPNLNRPNFSTLTRWMTNDFPIKTISKKNDKDWKGLQRSDWTSEETCQRGAPLTRARPDLL